MRWVLLILIVLAWLWQVGAAHGHFGVGVHGAYAAGHHHLLTNDGRQHQRHEGHAEEGSQAHASFSDRELSELAAEIRSVHIHHVDRPHHAKDQCKKFHTEFLLHHPHGRPASLAAYSGCNLWREDHVYHSKVNVQLIPTFDAIL